MAIVTQKCFYIEIKWSKSKNQIERKTKFQRPKSSYLIGEQKVYKR